MPSPFLAIFFAIVALLDNVYKKNAFFVEGSYYQGGGLLSAELSRLDAQYEMDDTILITDI